MDIAREAAEQGHDGYFVIQAGEQVSGRGRRGHHWASPKGNLYQTILLRPSVPRQFWGQLSFVIAVALSETVQDIANDPVPKIDLKWPNDVLISGRKMAGILIEAGDDFVLIGTGVNVEHAPEDRAKINDFADMSVDAVRDVFLSKIGEYYEIWQNDGFDSIRTLWMQKSYRKGLQIQANLKDRSITGIFHDIDKNGALILRSDQGEDYVITSAEIINWNS